MPQYVIDTLKPKNNNNFPVAEAVDVLYEEGSTVKDKIIAINALIVAAQQLIEGIQTNISELQTDVSELQSGKVDKVTGKGLSTNDFTTAYKNKIDNTYTKSETDSAIAGKIAEVVAEAPESFDTLKEIADWIDTHADSASAMNSAIQANTANIEKKVDKVSGKGLSTNDFTTAYKDKIDDTYTKSESDSITSAISARVAENESDISQLQTDVASKASISALTETNNTVAANKANLQSQIDTLVVESVGDSNAEVVQARVGVDGTTYGTLKSRLDAADTKLTEKFNKTSNDLSEILTTLSDKVSNVKRLKQSYPLGFINKGYYQTNGYWNADNNVRTTDYIDVRGCDVIKATGRLNNSAFFVVFFDKNKEILKDISISNSTSSSPSVASTEIDMHDSKYINAAYIKVSAYLGADAELCGFELITFENWIEKDFTPCITETKKNFYTSNFPNIGYYYTNGTFQNDAQCKRTDYIPILGAKRLVARGKLNDTALAVVFFNKNKEILNDISVGGTGSTPTPVDVDIDLTASDYVNAEYVMVCAYETTTIGYFVNVIYNSEIYNAINDKANADEMALKCIVSNIANPEEIRDGGCYHFQHGEWQEGSYADYSGVITKVTQNTLYYISNPTGYIVFYDENMNYIGGHGAGGSNGKEQLTGNPILTPEHCVYMATHIKTANKSKMYVSTVDIGYVPYGSKIVIPDKEILDDYTPVLKKDVKNSFSSINNKKINAFGDSITSTDYKRPNWWEQIATRTGASFNDYGFSGTTLAHTHDRHLWKQHFQKDDANEIGYVKEDPTTWNTGNCFCERIDRTDENADGIIIMGGTNDNGVPRGSWNSTDTSTFFGALNVLFQKALNRFAGKPILVCTPIQAKGSYSANIANALSELLEKNDSDTLSLQLRAEAIKAKCYQYGIHCLDLYNTSGINGADSNGTYYINGDTLHPSEIGQYRLSTLIQSELEKLF